MRKWTVTSLTDGGYKFSSSFGSWRVHSDCKEVYTAVDTLHKRGRTLDDDTIDSIWRSDIIDIAGVLRGGSRPLDLDELLVDSATNQSTASKPPVGLTPRSIWLTSCAEARVAEIAQAMQRYTASRLPIPQGWLDEYHELCTQLKGS